MKLRTLLIAFLVTALVVVAYVYTQRAGTRLKKAFLQIETLQNDSIGKYARTVVSAYRYQVRATQRRTERDSRLGKAILLSSSDLRASLVDIQKETLADAVQVVGDLDGRRWNVGSKLNIVPDFALSKSESGIFVYNETTDPILVAHSPLRLYEEHVGTLFLGFRFNGNIAKEIAAGSGTQVQFVGRATGSPDEIPITIFDDNKLVLSVKGGTLSELGRATRTEVIYVGVVSLLLIIFITLAVIEFGFVRGFRTLVRSLSDNAAALSRGEIRDLPERKRRGVWEIRRLWEVFALYTSNLRTFRARVEAKSATEAMGKIADQVAHDLRSPLTALTMLNQSYLDGVAPEVKSIFEGAINRMKGILDGLRDQKEQMKQAVATTGEIETEVSLVPLVDEIVKEKAAQYFDRANIVVKTQFTSPDARARIQPIEFGRVVSNLLDNSYQAIETEGTIWVKISEDGARIAIDIKDTGRGIPQARLSQLFHRGATFGKSDGSGLGLWHARESIAKWGGEIALDSEIGVGTKITLKLPSPDAPKTSSEILLSLLIGLTLFSATGLRADSLGETLVYQQIVPEGDRTDRKLPARVGFVLESLPLNEPPPLDREYLESLVRYRFAKAGVELETVPLTFRDDIFKENVGRELLLRPKFVITLRNRPNPKRLDSVLEVELSLIEYTFQDGRYLMTKPWSRTHRLTGLSGASLEEDLSRLIQRESAVFLEEHGDRLHARDDAGARNFKYRLEYRDPESLSSLVGLGVTAGLPLYVNGRIAYWGSVKFPVVVGISGIYLGTENRGFQFDVGYAFQRVGKWKHAAGLALSRMNVTTHSETTIGLELGRTATRTETVHAMRTHLGPSYSVQWGAFHFMAGALFPVQSGGDSWSPRVLLQVGYVPTFSL